MADINCPYCDTEQDINHDDGYGYEENEIYQQECCNCNKTFIYTTSIYYERMADYGYDFDNHFDDDEDVEY